MKCIRIHTMNMLSDFILFMGRHSGMLLDLEGGHEITKTERMIFWGP